MINKIIFYLKRAKILQFVNLGLSRAAATSALRKIDPILPASWEFSGFSQNGEDGIIDFLISKIKDSNRYFIEIGSLDGTENNSTWLALAKKFSGLMVEGNKKRLDSISSFLVPLNLGIDCLHLFLNKENIHILKSQALHLNPDLFSIDIDGNDYYMVKLILEAGFRPKVFVVEYNSTFGPEKAITIKYNENFDFRKAHPTELYFGASIMAWRRLFDSFGYKFLTVETNGTNAFFVDPNEFDRDFLTQIKGANFKENFYDLRRFKNKWEKRFDLISDMDFIEV